MKGSQLQKLASFEPHAARKLHRVEWHGEIIEDPYHWLRDDSYPKIDDSDVLAYLEQENAYFDAFIKPQSSLVNALVNEMKGRLDETEESVPYVDNGYEYRWFYQEEANYRTRVRKKLGSDEEQVFLDEEALAKNLDYFVLGGWDISADNRYLVYSIDATGDERYQVYVKDLENNQLLNIDITNTDGSVAFSPDSKTILFGRLNKIKWRTDDIVKFDIFSQKHKVIFSEYDEEYYLGFNFTSDDKFLILGVQKGGTTESYAIPSDNLNAKPRLFASRDLKFQYQVDHAHGQFYILANDAHVNFRLASTPSETPSYDHWETLIKGSDETYLKGIQTFDKFYIIYQSKEAYEQLIVSDYQDNRHQVTFPEEMISIRCLDNFDFYQDYLRIGYESFLTPDTVYDYNVSEQKITVRKVKAIPSGYDANQYETKRLMAKARDGQRIPISILYKKGVKLNGENPVHMIAYGAYGYGYETSFSSERFSLVDRGVVFALAHIRGGDDLGYQWYLDGKLKNRQNTFNDFIDSANYLITEGYTSPKNISISGRSAGGKLMGAVMNQHPELWSSVILGVPFVDVLNTILDESLPLTPPEWEEWGNPIESKEYFDLIRSYSPYDNIQPKAYPPMMVTAGLNDPRVTYWEPAKFTAKMRHEKTDDNLLVMRMNMGAGHFANSGRYGRLVDEAQEYTFILLSHGIQK